jgi:sec-independent protein translocase protein TatA
MSSPDENAYFDADPTRVLVLDAELVRREGQSVCLVIREPRPPTADSPSPFLVGQREAPASDQEQPTTSRTSSWTLADPLPDRRWLPRLLSLRPLLVIVGGILSGFFLGWPDMIVLLILAVLLFGRELPEVGRYLGKGIVEYKKGIRGLEEEESAPLTRRATVRYYNRMNPERVYPLLVLITRDMVEKVHKKHTDQRTSAPFTVDAQTPVEIEPVLPGCDCHPPRVVTRLGQDDLTLTFRVVPRVLGKVDGAVVCIRQDHTSLAAIELDVKVVKQKWVVLSGVATFLLPGLSAVMKHFGVDFEAQKGQGFSLYVAIVRLVFDHVSPYTLTALLAVATALLWWLTRPRRRDVFWDIEPARAR